MKALKDAQFVLKILKREGYDAYIVGGAVRDYLLKVPINDIDITTNAKPFEVLKLFKGVETGVKYGTVTIFFKEQEYQVTTFRSESSYSDLRRPDEVSFEDDVVRDLERRDFTINSLIMDDTGKIFDHFGGMKDLKFKYLKTVGSPVERFNEDALRIMRAFYFISKLGFNLDIETENAIKENVHLIKEISSERVLAEMIKIIQSDNLKLAFSKLLDTNVASELPGLYDGIKHFVKVDEKPFVDVFFATSFSLFGSVPGYWKFSNLHRNRYQQVVNIVKNNLKFDAKTLYQYGLEISMLANRVLYALDRDILRTNEITHNFNHLPLKSSLDLKFRGKDLLNVTNRKAGAWVNKLTEALVLLVLDQELENDYDVLKEYVINNFEKY